MFAKGWNAFIWKVGQKVFQYRFGTNKAIFIWQILMVVRIWWSSTEKKEVIKLFRGLLARVRADMLIC